ncbi:MAG: hypothetical protein O6940_07485 [Ignavibacteria bacterium]|nr:hypothetical protein [Ignavibacteria bacterium]
MKTKKKLILICYSFLILVSSCIPSLHPLYTKKDLILDNTIVGTWISNESERDRSIWKIKKYQDTEAAGTNDINPLDLGDNLYRLEHIQLGETIVFDLYLMKLDNYFYFDFYPNEVGFDNDMKDMHLFPVHTFAKVNIKQDNIIIEQFDINFLEELIEQNKIKISHEKSGQNIILTASTGELQKFVVKYASDEDAVFDPIILNRKIESRE